MRNAYLNELYNLAKNDENVVSLVSDNGLIVYDDFRRDFPDRYFNFGIAEGNMVAAAAGMASVGKIPFAYTISAFLAYRSYEFIRDDVCFQNQNVKIIGIGSGLTYSTLGPSHQTTEDIGLLRSIPNLYVFSPSCKSEMKWIMHEAYRHIGPVYIRLGNNNIDYYDERYEFELGVPAIVKNGTDITIATTGPIINEVMKAAEMLQLEGISAKVVSFHTLKPLNEKRVVEIIDTCNRLIVVEEHNVIGGLYSAISEALTAEKVSLAVTRIGLDDRFSIDYGTLDNVRIANKLDSVSIFNKIMEEK